jgi:hypothetical protein
VDPESFFLLAELLLLLAVGPLPLLGLCCFGDLFDPPSCCLLLGFDVPGFHIFDMTLSADFAD